VTYRIALGTFNGTPSVSVALKYQTLAFGFLNDLETDADDPAVARFLDLYEASAIRAETIAVSGDKSPAPEPPIIGGQPEPSRPGPGPGGPGNGHGPGGGAGGQ
jgi:hypothetical protein